MTEHQILATQKRENAYLLRELNRITGETYRQRHAPNGAELAYLMRGSTAISGYMTQPAIGLVLLAIQHAALTASAKTAQGDTKPMTNH